MIKPSIKQINTNGDPLAAKLTIIIPTHERHLFLKRVLEWYKDLNCKIYVVDSSKDKFDGELDTNNVHYWHLPNDTYISKVCKIVDLVQTPYVLFLADDDFIFVNSLEPAIQFLEEHDDFASVQGYHLAFDELDINRDVQYKLIHKYAENLEYDQASAQVRVSSILNCYMNNFYALQRTSVWQSLRSFLTSETLFNQVEAPVFELTQAIHCVAFGKSKFIPLPWLLREHIPESSGGKFDFESFLKSHVARDWAEKLICKLRETCSEEGLTIQWLNNELEWFISFYQDLLAGRLAFIDKKYVAILSDVDLVYFNLLKEHILVYRGEIVTLVLDTLGVDTYLDKLYFPGWKAHILDKTNYIEQISEKIIIYGAGEHTENLLNVVPKLREKIYAITDSNSELWEQRVADIQCMQLGKALQGSRIILISSLSSEEEIYGFLSDNLSPDVKIIRLYD